MQHAIGSTEEGRDAIRADECTRPDPTTNLEPWLTEGLRT